MPGTFQLSVQLGTPLHDAVAASQPSHEQAAPHGSSSAALWLPQTLLLHLAADAVHESPLQIVAGSGLQDDPRSLLDVRSLSFRSCCFQHIHALVIVGTIQNPLRLVPAAGPEGILVVAHLAIG